MRLFYFVLVKGAYHLITVLCLALQKSIKITITKKKKKIKWPCWHLLWQKNLFLLSLDLLSKVHHLDHCGIAGMKVKNPLNDEGHCERKSPSSSSQLHQRSSLIMSMMADTFSCRFACCNNCSLMEFFWVLRKNVLIFGSRFNKRIVESNQWIIQCLYGMSSIGTLEIDLVNKTLHRRYSQL